MPDDRQILDRAAGLLAVAAAHACGVDDGAKLHCLAALGHLVQAGAQLEAEPQLSGDAAALIAAAFAELAMLSPEVFATDAVLDAIVEVHAAREAGG